jgi:GDP-L-fucose synthase
MNKSKKTKILDSFNNKFRKKNILITGGTGMVGIQLLFFLSELDCFVHSTSLDNFSPNLKNVKHSKIDLREPKNCNEVTKDMDLVINVTGVAGSPKMALENPASFMSPNILLPLNILNASVKNKVKEYLFTSSYGVYKPSKLMKEDDVWKTSPSNNDLYAGWAKRISELYLTAVKIENSNFKKLYTIRPSNIFGPYANFDFKNSMVIQSLINRIFLQNESPLKVWGNGSAIRDFIYSKDVALSILQLVNKGYDKKPVNIGSGTGCSIKTLVETIVTISKKKISLQWDTSMPSGDQVRILDIKRAKKLGIENFYTLSEGLKETIDWFKNNKNLYKKKYNSFNEK